MLLGPTWDSVRTQLTAWAEPILAVLGILTLLGAIYSWYERRQTAKLQVARRGRRVLRVIDEWLNEQAYDLANAARLEIWQQHVSRGENEVQALLEAMVDLAAGASPRVQRATRRAYREFLHGADLINNFGQSGTSWADQAAAAHGHFEQVFQQVAAIVPPDLL